MRDANPIFLGRQAGFVRPHLVVIATVVGAVLMFALATAFSAERTARQAGTGDTATFTDLPCTHPAVVKRLDPRLVKEYRAARVTFAGKRYAACYTETGKSFFVVYEDGETGVVPKRDLLPQT